MSLTAGIVGLPNVGKSTLFNAITNSRVEAANYPFSTIEPNVGLVEVKDERLTKLAEIFEPLKTIYTTFEFTDIAGLVKGASKGEGLGNQFLSNIREVDAICHVVRCFDDNNISHVYNRINPKEDIEIINMELIMADLESCENRITKLEKRVKAKEKGADKEMHLMQEIHKVLESGHLISTMDVDDDEKLMIKGFQFLTSKPVIYIANLKEDDINNPETNPYYKQVKEYALTEGNEVVAVAAKIEEDLSYMPKEEKMAFMEELGITRSGLDEVILKAYNVLGLKTFFTVGKDECRGWTFKDGMKAPQCAGIIHTDFEKGFIRAEVYSYDDFMVYQSEAKLKEAGKLRLEGKDYVAKDGDIMHFRFHV